MSNCRLLSTAATIVLLVAAGPTLAQQDTEENAGYTTGLSGPIDVMISPRRLVQVEC